MIETRSGRYAVAVIPLEYSPIPGFRATAVQAVRTDDPMHAVRLTLYERETSFPDPHHGPRAA